MCIFRPKHAIVCVLTAFALANIARESGFILFLLSDPGVSDNIAILPTNAFSSKQDNPLLLCTHNPYAHKLVDTMETVAQRMQDWVSTSYESMLHQAQTNESWQVKWNAFTPFEPLTSCQPNERQCIGGPCRSDTSKITCGLSGLQPGCIVYSIGGNNQWQFEMDILAKTPCHVHTFDCTGKIQRFKVPPHERLHFHHVCLGTTPQPASPDCTVMNKVNYPKCGPTLTLAGIQQLLGHDKIDLYKMDIEGFEIPLFRSWPELHQAQNVTLPTQLLVEIHYKTAFADLWYPGQTHKMQPFISPAELVELQRHLVQMGYAVVERDDNQKCPHCTELTLVRTRCPPGEQK